MKEKIQMFKQHDDILEGKPKMSQRGSKRTGDYHP